MVRLLIGILFLSSAAFAHSSSTTRPEEDYAREIINHLAAPGMHGRGYVNHGDRIAAKYIEGQFKKDHVDVTVQKFKFPINTFPGKMHISFDDLKLNVGADYIVSAGAPNLKGEFAIVRNPAATDDLSQVFVWASDDFDSRKEPNPYKGAKGIIVSQNKLTAHMAQKVDGFVLVEVLKSSIPATTPLMKKIKIDVESKFIEQYESQNIIATVKGSRTPDSFIVFTAHYDHLGQMGTKVFFPGANDNASGIAMLLNLARHFSEPANQPPVSMMFVAFSGEEVGLLGSKYYVEHPTVPLEQIRFLLNFDMVGTGDDGIQVVNSVDHPAEFKTLVDLNNQFAYLKEVKTRGNAKISDHYPFTEHGVKALFIYTLGGIKAYHDVYDRRKTLPLTRFENLFQLLVEFTKTL